jgi:hypothetical protein
VTISFSNNILHDGVSIIMTSIGAENARPIPPPPKRYKRGIIIKSRVVFIWHLIFIIVKYMILSYAAYFL